MSTLLWMAMGVIAVVVLVVTLSWLIARLWCEPRRHISPRGPADYGLAYDPIQFTSNNVPLRGWFIPTASKTLPMPAVVLVHGWSKNAADMLPAAWALHRFNFALALYDARGHGASGQDGPITILKFAEDVRACLDYLDTRADVDHSRVGVLGHSLGGAGVLLAAAMDPRIRAAVSCSAFADPRAITRDFLRKHHIPVWPFLSLACRFIEHWLGTSMESIAPQSRVGQIRAPLLLLHGEDDRFVPPTDMEALYSRSAHDRTKMRRLSSRRHADVTRDVPCGEQIVAFFVTHLSATSDSSCLEAIEMLSKAGQLSGVTPWIKHDSIPQSTKAGDKS